MLNQHGFTTVVETSKREDRVMVLTRLYEQTSRRVSRQCISRVRELQTAYYQGLKK